MAAVAQWHPGHMIKAMRHIKDNLKYVDLVMEIRDARIPFTSANDMIEEAVRRKRRLCILNKADICDFNVTKRIMAQLEAQGMKVMRTSIDSNTAVNRVMREALAWLQRDRPKDMSMMLVAGIPNVGKSTLINAFKVASANKGLLEHTQGFNKRAKTGPFPGVTRQIGSFKVSKDPLVYLMDSPGITTPKFDTPEKLLKLGVTGAIPEDIPGRERMVRYLLWTLVQPQHLRQLERHLARNMSSYAHLTEDEQARMRMAMKLARHVLEVLTTDVRPTGESEGMTVIDMRLELLLQRLGATDNNRESKYGQLLAAFRKGDLGSYTLDAPIERPAVDSVD